MSLPLNFKGLNLETKYIFRMFELVIAMHVFPYRPCWWGARSGSPQKQLASVLQGNLSIRCKEHVECLFVFVVFFMLRVLQLQSNVVQLTASQLSRNHPLNFAPATIDRLCTQDTKAKSRYFCQFLGGLPHKLCSGTSSVTFLSGRYQNLHSGPFQVTTFYLICS